MSLCIFFLCVKSPPDWLILDLIICKSILRTWAAVIFMVIVHYGKMMKIKISIEKRYISWSPGEIRHKFPVVPFHGVTKDTLNSTRNDVWQHMKIIANQGRLPEPWCPDFLFWVSHIGLQHLGDWSQLLRHQPHPTRAKAGVYINHIVGINLSSQTGTV